MPEMPVPVPTNAMEALDHAALSWLEGDTAGTLQTARDWGLSPGMVLGRAKQLGGVVAYVREANHAVGCHVLTGPGPHYVTGVCHAPGCDGGCRPRPDDGRCARCAAVVA